MIIAVGRAISPLQRRIHVVVGLLHNFRLAPLVARSPDPQLSTPLVALSPAAQLSTLVAETGDDTHKLGSSVYAAEQL